MYKNLPRQTFGRLQSKLFPIYFKLHAASLCVMLGTMGAVGGAGSLTRPLVACGSALVFTLINVLYLEPQSTKARTKRARALSTTTRRTWPPAPTRDGAQRRLARRSSSP
jgi:hypothetical protein